MRSLSTNHFLVDTSEGFKDVQNSKDEDEIKKAPVKFYTVEEIAQHYHDALLAELNKMPHGTVVHIDLSVVTHE